MTPKEEVEELMGEGLQFAEEMLREHGEFYPFAVAKNATGEVVQVGAETPTEHPSSGEVLATLELGLRSGADHGQYVAAAIFVAVLVAPPGSEAKCDAVHVGLEHRTGYSADVFLPYHVLESGEMAYGVTFACDRPRCIFRLE